MRQGEWATIAGSKPPKDPARTVRPKEPFRPEEPALTPFIDVIFQILIFFMLSMKFKQQEGHLLTMLPKREGLSASPADLKLDEVRVYVCADMNRRMDQHIGYKEKHQDFIRDQKKAGQPVGDICYAQIELNFKDQDQLFRTEKYPGKWGHNRAIYNKLCDQVKAMLDVARSSRDPAKPVPAILDIDGNAPFEHAIGLLNGLTKRKISDIEWAGNPRFDRYFGPEGP